MNIQYLKSILENKVVYSPDEKKTYHRIARNLMRKLADALQLPSGGFDVRSTEDGVSMSGEVTLHADWIYVQLSQRCTGPHSFVMYRLCNGRKDFIGRENNFCTVDEFLNIDEFADRLVLLRLQAPRRVANFR